MLATPKRCAVDYFFQIFKDVSYVGFVNRPRLASGPQKKRRPCARQSIGNLPMTVYREPWTVDYSFTMARPHERRPSGDLTLANAWRDPPSLKMLDVVKNAT